MKECAWCWFLAFTRELSLQLHMNVSMALEMVHTTQSLSGCLRVYNTVLKQITMHSYTSNLD